jgi:hypothetical protein
MIKLMLAGLWVCLVTLGSTYGVVAWRAAAPPPAPAPAPAHAHAPAPAAPSPAAHPTHEVPMAANGMESLRTKMISVPVVADNAVQGYVMAQFAYTADSKIMKQLVIKPDVYMVDEAFKAIFGSTTVDFRQFKKQDLPALTKQIATNVNKRLGVRVIDDVLVQELNYIPKDQVRGGRKL